MSNKATETYVKESLALQGVRSGSDAAAVIAPVLSGQLAKAGEAYAKLPFEAEPAAFLGVMARERG